MAQPGSAVLVAEDNEDIRELVVHQLRRMGVEVLQAGNGRQAIDLALAEQPALVLMDMDMPVMSGFDAVAQLRLRGYTRPILALTGYNEGPGGGARARQRLRRTARQAHLQRRAARAGCIRCSRKLPTGARV